MMTITHVIGRPLLSLLLLGVPPASTPVYPPASEASANLDAALASAKAQDRLVLVDFGANWCVWCRGLAHIFERNSDVRALLLNRYVVSSVNVEEFKANLDLAERLGVRDLSDTGIPILVILRSDGTVVARKDASDFEQPNGKGFSEAAVLNFLEQHACPSELARAKGKRAGA